MCTEKQDCRLGKLPATTRYHFTIFYLHQRSPTVSSRRKQRGWNSSSCSSATDGRPWIDGLKNTADSIETVLGENTQRTHHRVKKHSGSCVLSRPRPICRSKVDEETNIQSVVDPNNSWGLHLSIQDSADFAQLTNTAEGQR